MTRSTSTTRYVSLLTIALLLFFSPILADSHFEGFEADDEFDAVEETIDIKPTDLPLTTASQPDLHDPDPEPTRETNPQIPTTTTTSTSFDYLDEDEFEGFPTQQTPQEPPEIVESTNSEDTQKPEPTREETEPRKLRSFIVEIVCVSFLILFITNYFLGKRTNENIALSWASKFATKDSIFDKNFSLLGVGDGNESPILLKEGQNVFKFYASGRRFCQGLLATMELKSRHDLISRVYYLVVPCKDEISFEVYMNDDAMDHVVFALARKKLAKAMQKEVLDLQRFGGVLTQGPQGRKWVTEELGVVSESKEVAGDLITEAVLEQVFGEKAFERYGKYFISMHFSDQQPGTHKKMLLFKFALPCASDMADMTRLVALVPYYIDLIGRYKLSPQAKSKTEVARTKAAQEAVKEFQNARQEALQKKKAEKKKLLEEAEAKLSAEAIRKREAKERARQMKKTAPKVKMSRVR